MTTKKELRERDAYIRNATVEEMRKRMVRLFLTPAGYPRSVDLTQVHQVLDRMKKR
jgi:hypothetical protein